MSRPTLAAILLTMIFMAASSCKHEEKAAIPQTPCDRFSTYLNGTFKSPYLEGTMTFKGGMSGNVEIAGLDFNDMTCSYSVLDCNSGQTDMNCEGSSHQEIIQIYTADSIRIGASVFLRI